jgi:hypothetical protein
LDGRPAIRYRSPLMSAALALKPMQPAAAGHAWVGVRTFAITNDQPRGT